jgi:hypothetical protein
MVVAPTDRVDSDPVLHALVHQELGRYPPNIASHALSAALTAAEARQIADQQERKVVGTSKGGMPLLLAYMRKVLRHEADDLKRAHAVSEAADRTELVVQQERLASRLSGVGAARSGRRQTRKSWEELGKEVFATASAGGRR